MTETMADDLAALPDLYNACEAVLGGRRQHFTNSRVRGGLSRGLSLNEGALRARSRILEILSSWSGLVASERDVRPPRRELGSLVSFLISHVDWLATHPAANDFAAEISEIAADARRAAGMESSVRHEIGKCCLHAACSRRVWATVCAGGTVDMRCEAGHNLPPHRWLLLGELP